MFDQKRLKNRSSKARLFNSVDIGYGSRSLPIEKLMYLDVSSINVVDTFFQYLDKPKV